MSLSGAFNAFEAYASLSFAIGGADAMQVAHVFERVKSAKIPVSDLCACADETPLVLAVLERGDALYNRKDERAAALLAIAKLCLSFGVPVDAPENSQGRTAFMMSAGNSDFDMMDLLARHGANVDHQSKDGDTALMEAARESYYDPHSEEFDLRGLTAVKLLEMGARSDLMNSQNQTAAGIARAEGCLEMGAHISSFPAAKEEIDVLLFQVHFNPPCNLPSLKKVL